MIKEYAIEPEAIDNWTSLKTLLDSFAPDKGRIVLEYPSYRDWCKKCYKQMNFNNIAPRQKTKIQNLLDYSKQQKNPLKSIFFQRKYSVDASWIDMITRFHMDERFDGILCENYEEKNLDSIKDFLIDKQLFEEETIDNIVHFKPWNSSTERSCDKFLSKTKKLLRISTNFIFVDPHFENMNTRHTQPLVKWMEYIASVNEQAEISYHTGNSNDFNEFLRKINNFKCSIPKNITLYIYKWDSENFFNVIGEDLHNRYIITNVAGLTFNHGLDVDQKNNPPGRDTITLLDKDSHSSLYKKLTNDICRKYIAWHST